MNRLRGFISLGFWVAAAFAVYALIYKPAAVYQEELHLRAAGLSQDIASLEARIAGLQSSDASVQFPPELLWTRGEATEVELALQDSIVGLAGQHNITLMSFGPSGLTREVSQAMTAFEFEVEAPLGSALSFLADMERHEPKIAIGILRMRHTQTYTPDPVEDVTIYAQFVVWVFRGGAT